MSLEHILSMNECWTFWSFTR